MAGRSAASKTTIQGDAYVIPEEDAPLLAPPASKKSDNYWRDITILSSITVFFGVGNNISFAQMAGKLNSMDYAPWLLYATALPYTFLYTIVVLLKARSMKAQRFDLWGAYVLLGLAIGFSGILSQFSDPFVRVDLQGVLTVLVLPATYIGVKIFLEPHRKKLAQSKATSESSVSVDVLDGNEAPPLAFMKRHTALIGCIVIMTGIVVAPMQSLFTPQQTRLGTPLGIICFASSQILQAAVDIIQQRIFHKNHASVYPQLLYSNIVTIPLYAMTPFLTMIPSLGGRNLHQVWQDQVDATNCFVGTSTLPPNCSSGAVVWVVAFVLFYVMYFIFTAILVNKYDAIMQSVVISIVSPLTSIFAIVPAFGNELPPATLYVSLGIVSIGCALYIYGDHLHRVHQK